MQDQIKNLKWYLLRYHNSSERSRDKKCHLEWMIIIHDVERKQTSQTKDDWKVNENL